MKNKYIKIIIFVSILIILDQLTKFLIVTNFKVNDSLIIIKNFLDFTYITNTGAAFGMFSGNTIILGIISFILIWYIVKEINVNINSKLELFSLSLVLSGAVGNLIDRLLRRFVVDFISFKLFNLQMPVFNVADIYVTIGVFLLIICIIRGEHKNENKNKTKRHK